jgi:hypothetical protein
LGLARVGIENLAEYLADGVTGWIQNGFKLDYVPKLLFTISSNSGTGSGTGSQDWTYASP